MRIYKIEVKTLLFSILNSKEDLQNRRENHPSCIVKTKECLQNRSETMLFFRVNSNEDLQNRSEIHSFFGKFQKWFTK